VDEKKKRELEKLRHKRNAQSYGTDSKPIFRGFTHDKAGVSVDMPACWKATIDKKHVLSINFLSTECAAGLLLIASPIKFDVRKLGEDEARHEALHKFLEMSVGIKESEPSNLLYYPSRSAIGLNGNHIWITACEDLLVVFEITSIVQLPNVC
jgi:hypothetical protein